MRISTWIGRRAVTVLAQSFEAQGAAPPSATSSSRLLIVVALLACGVPLSAVPRYVAGIPMAASLAVSLIGVVAAIVVLWPFLGFAKLGRGTVVGFSLVFIAYSVAALVLTSASPLQGFPAGSCADAGNHVFLKNEFVFGDPKVYQGMVTLYALDHWLIRLGLDDLSALRLIWQVVVVGCAALGGAVVCAASATMVGPWQRGISTAVVALVLAVAGFFVTLPLLQYYQLDGYLAQLFSLFPIALLAGSYAFASSRLVRVLVLVGGLGFYRFTYLLNAGDLLLTVAVLLLVESNKGVPSSRARWALRALALALAGAGVGAYVGLNQIILIPGGFRAAPLPPQIAGLGLLALAFGSAGPLCRRFGTPLPHSVARLALLLALMCGVPALIVSIWLLSG